MASERYGVTGWLIAVYGVLGAAGLAVVMWGSRVDRPEIMASGIVLAGLAGASAPIAFLLLARAGSGAGSGSGGDVAAEVERLSAAVTTMNEQAGLSDDARRVLNRSRERELLRGAIEEDIEAEDWDAAMVLVKELAERFGYRADAEQFRTRIETARFQVMDRRVAEGVEGVDRLITQLRWDDARAEADRIIRLFPDSPKVEGLRHRVSTALDRYKADLERRFLHAAEGERIEEAMELLRELDQHLNPAEAERYQEVARGVIGKARENLGVQFKLAIQDRNWTHAAATGEQIIREFPNTRMAEEVRGMIDEVRERASSLA